MSRIRIHRRSQPPISHAAIDWSNPITRGLEFAAVLRGGEIVNAVTGRRPIESNVGAKATPDGLLANLPNADSVVAFADSELPNYVTDQRDFSVVFYGQGSDVAANNQRMAQRTEDAASVNVWVLCEVDNGSNNVQFSIRRNNSQSNARIGGTGNWNNERPSLVIATATHTAGDSFDCTLRIDGEEYLDTGGAALGGGDDNTFTIGKRRDASDDPWYGSVGLLLVYGRALPVADRKRLDRNPWQIFRPRTIYLPGDEPAPGSAGVSRIVIPRRSQPPISHAAIDWSNPLARGLDWGRTFASPSLTEPDLARGIKPSVSDFSSGIETIPGYGVARVMRTTGVTGDYFSSNYEPQHTTFSGAALFRMTGGSDGTLMAQRDGGINFWQIYADGSSPYDILFRGGGVTPIVASNVVSIDEWMLLSWTVVNDDNVYLYKNGKLIGTEPIGAVAAQNIPISVGHRWQGEPSTGFELAGDFALALYWRRVLRGVEHAALARQLWQLFRPRTIYIPGAPAAAPLLVFPWRRIRTTQP